MNDDDITWLVRTLAGSAFTVTGELVIDYPLVSVRNPYGIVEFAGVMDNLDYIVQDTDETDDTEDS